MEDMLKSDIFFLVTTVAVVFVTALVLVILVYILGIVSDVKKIFSRFLRGEDAISDDLFAIRESIKHGIRSLINFFKSTAKRGNKKPKRKLLADKNNNE